MPLHPQTDFAIPEETIRVASAAYPRGNVLMKMRDAPGTIYQDQSFASLFPHNGRAVEAPWRLALITVLQFMEELSAWHAADAARVHVCAIVFVRRADIRAEHSSSGHRPNTPRSKPHDSGSVANPSNRDMLFGLGLRHPFHRGCGPLTCADLGMWACRKRICSTWPLRRQSICFAWSTGLMAARSLLPAFRLLRGSTRLPEESASSVQIGGGSPPSPPL